MEEKMEYQEMIDRLSKVIDESILYLSSLKESNDNGEFDGNYPEYPQEYIDCVDDTIECMAKVIESMKVLRGIVRQDEKVFKAGCLGMLSIIVGTLIGGFDSLYKECSDRLVVVGLGSHARDSVAIFICRNITKCLHQNRYAPRHALVNTLAPKTLHQTCCTRNITDRHAPTLSVSLW